MKSLVPFALVTSPLFYVLHGNILHYGNIQQPEYTLSFKESIYGRGHVAVIK